MAAKRQPNRTSEVQPGDDLDDVEVVEPENDVMAPVAPIVPESEKPPRRLIASQDFSYQSLVGTWALYHAPGVRTEQCLIVAEPQAGFYLCEFHHLVENTPLEQRVLTLGDFAAKRDDEGGRWTFYDDLAAIRKALGRLA